MRGPVLLVEDDASTRDSVCEVLAEEGYTVEPFADGPSFLARLDRSPAPRVVLLDWVMPGMSGPDVMAALREGDRLRELPVIAFSASGPRETPEGVREVLRKPTDLELLLSTVARYCD